jgi:hypothetical protein
MNVQVQASSTQHQTSPRPHQTLTTHLHVLDRSKPHANMRCLPISPLSMLHPNLPFSLHSKYPHRRNVHPQDITTVTDVTPSPSRTLSHCREIVRDPKKTECVETPRTQPTLRRLVDCIPHRDRAGTAGGAGWVEKEKKRRYFGTWILRRVALPAHDVLYLGRVSEVSMAPVDSTSITRGHQKRITFDTLLHSSDAGLARSRARCRDRRRAREEFF